MVSYREWQTTGAGDTPSLAPPRLRERWGAALMGVLGGVKDDIASATREAVKVRFLETCPDDALPEHGAERGIERYPGEGAPSYRARLRAAWETWLYAGTRRGVLAALSAAGFTAAIYDVRAAPAWWVGAWPPNNPGGMVASDWARFYVVLSAPFPFAWAVRHWGDGSDWGELGADGTPLLWGSTATLGQLEFVRALIRKWKAAHERCAYVFVRVVDGASTVTLRWQGV